MQDHWRPVFTCLVPFVLIGFPYKHTLERKKPSTCPARPCDKDNISGGVSTSVLYLQVCVDCQRRSYGINAYRYAATALARILRSVCCPARMSCERLL